MGCLPLPPIPFPVLPAGFSITPPDPYPKPYPPGICCQVIGFPVPSPPLPLPPFVVNPAFIAALTAAMKTVQAYVDAIPLKCPKETDLGS